MATTMRDPLNERSPGTAAHSSEAQKQNKRPDFNRFQRVPEQDRRIARGDDFAADAWLDAESGLIVYGAPGRDRNAAPAAGGP
jgi:hypothetical protein